MAQRAPATRTISAKGVALGPQDHVVGTLAAAFQAAAGQQPALTASVDRADGIAVPFIEPFALGARATTQAAPGAGPVRLPPGRPPIGSGGHQRCGTGC